MCWLVLFKQDTDNCFWFLLLEEIQLAVTVLLSMLLLKCAISRCDSEMEMLVCFSINTVTPLFFRILFQSCNMVYNISDIRAHFVV